jgi:hypothetical protein
MVRRSPVDRSPQSGVYADYGAVAADSPPAPGPAAGRAPGTWSGGRWLVWLGRAVVWLVILLIGYNGVAAIMSRQAAGPAPGPPAGSRGQGFPSGLAAAYAMEFGQVYLNASPATAAQRASRLAAFLPPGADPQLGWNGSGTLTLGFEQVAGVRANGAHRGVVTLLAAVNGQLMELAVPVYSDGHGLVVSGEPAWLAAPGRAAMPSSSVTTSDSVTQAVLMSQLPSFFQAYASGNQATLARFLAPGTVIGGRGGQVSYGSLTGLTVPPGGAARNVTATVMWRLPGQAAPAGHSPPAALEVTYALRVEKRSGTWYVKDISPSNQPIGPP